MKIILISITSIALFACSIVHKKGPINAKSGVVKIDIQCFNDTVRFLNETDLVSRAEIKNLLTKVSIKTKNIARNKGFERMKINMDGTPMVKTDPITGEVMRTNGPCGIQDVLDMDLVLFSSIAPFYSIFTALPSDTILVTLECTGKSSNNNLKEFQMMSYGKFVDNELVEFKITDIAEIRNSKN